MSPSLEKGLQVIQSCVKTLPDTPGVYRMLDSKGDALYVGKAKALKRRVNSYTQITKLPDRLKRMVTQTAQMEIVHTHTEAEALLLESNLIKKLKPRYNILLRDDKSFPYILITGDHDFPQVTKHRGSRKREGEYFGPFASTGAVNQSIAVLQRAFQLRNCSDNVFAHRSRPCLLSHINSCTAPCVNKVSQEEYAIQVAQARAFLTGESRAVQNHFVQEMERASATQDYESAAAFRDKIKAMTALQTKQDINIEGLGDADVIGLYHDQGQSCIQVFFFRDGQNFGNHAYFPRHDPEEKPEDVLAVFLAQFYLSKPVPKNIIISHPVPDQTLLEEALGNRPEAPDKITLHVPARGAKKSLMDFVLKNARAAWERHRLEKAGTAQMLEALADMFDLPEPPERIEVYDNAHISGTNMVGGMIVAGPEGFRKNAYRQFNIKEAAAGDDYGMMREVMQRRFRRALNNDNEEWPDLVLIDGGQGQFNVVKETLEEMGIRDQVCIVAIAKGPDRNAGREQFFMDGRAPFMRPLNDPALHYLQRLRDEAHRFANGTHRARRTKDIEKSPLDGIAGIGAQRKKALLRYFGSAKEVANAAIEDLQNVEGISRAMAEKIYHHFHDA